jgi:hypothetical protein
MCRASAILALLAFSVLAGAQPSPGSSSLEKITLVKDQEEALRQAQLKYDTVSAKSILADEFVGIWNNGEQANKEQFLLLIGDKDDPLQALDYGEMKIRVYGETAVVWSTIHERAVYAGKVDEYRGRRTAVWVKRGTRWQCATIHTSPFPENGHQNK